MEGVVRLEFQTGHFRGEVCGGRRNGSEARTIAIEVERAKFCCGKLDGCPFEGYRGLSNVPYLEKTDLSSDVRSQEAVVRTHAQVRVFWQVSAEFIHDGIL